METDQPFLSIESDTELDPGSTADAQLHQRSRPNNERGWAKEYLSAEHTEQRWEQLADGAKFVQETNGQAASDKAAGDGFDRWTWRSWVERWGWQLPPRQW